MLAALVGWLWCFYIRLLFQLSIRFGRGSVMNENPGGGGMKTNRQDVLRMSGWMYHNGWRNPPEPRGELTNTMKKFC